MTKKSASRLARDRAKKELKDNTCWDDLNAIYNDCARLLISHSAISAYAKDTDLHRYLPNAALTISNLKSLAKDLRQLNEELAGIRGEHEGKSGGSDDPDEVMSTFSIFEKYNLFTERHNAVVLPTAYQIIEEFKQAEQRRAQANAPTAAELAQSAGETGPIDVEVKDRTAVNLNVGEAAPADAQGAIEEAQKHLH